MNSNLAEAQREILATQFKHKVSLFQANDQKEKTIFDNQINAANDIMNKFLNGVTKFIQLIAQPGSGKTSVFFYLIYLMCTHIDDNFIVPVKRVFVITGMNDKDWEKQTRKNILPGCKKSHIFHGGCLRKLNMKIEKLKRKNEFNNCLFIIDECHVAAKEKQKVHKILEKHDLLNINFCEENKIYTLEVSATPGFVMYDKQLWNSPAFGFIKLESGKNYKGFLKYKDYDMIRPAFDLEEDDTYDEIEKLVDERWRDDPKYHIFRLPVDKKRYNLIVRKLRKVSRKNKWMIPIEHNSNQRIENLDDKMKDPPERHQIIYIKEFWRAGKRLETTHVGIVSERATGDASVTAQGLIGRFCGYMNIRDINTSTLFFCDVDAINQYLSWYEQGCRYETVEKYHSSNLNKTKKNLVVKTSYSNPIYVDGLVDPLKKLEITEHNIPGGKIPVVIDVNKEVIEQIKNLGKKKNAKIELCLKELEKENEQLAKELKDDYKCLTVSVFGEVGRRIQNTESVENSYKKNILDVLNHYDKNECDRVGINKKYNNDNVYLINCDHKENKLIFIMWNGEAYSYHIDTLYIEEHKATQRRKKEDNQ
jgi:hypothetical protein